MAQGGYAVAAHRDSGQWRIEPLPPTVLADLGVLLQALRSQPPEGGPFVVLDPGPLVADVPLDRLRSALKPAPAGGK